jgi:hypothetical protein
VPLATDWGAAEHFGRRLFVTGNADRRLKIARYGADGLLSDSELR